MDAILVGAGAIAANHARALQESPHVGGFVVCDPDPQARGRLVAGHPKARDGGGDFGARIATGGAGLVVNCTPHHLHLPVALAALEAGMDVITEKPIARCSDEGRQMVEAAQAAGRRLYVSMNQRFFPTHVKAKELLDAGAIGRPLLCVINQFGAEITRMGDPQSWKGSWELAGGGALVDTGYHAVYTMLHWCGRPTAVCAVTPRLYVEAENKADDNAVVSLLFGDRMAGSIVVSYTCLGSPWDEQRHLYGDEGHVFITDRNGGELALVQRHATVPAPIRALDPLHPLSVTAACTHGIECLVSGEPFGVDPQEAIDALVVIEAAYESWRNGVTVSLGE